MSSPSLRQAREDLVHRGRAPAVGGEGFLGRSIADQFEGEEDAESAHLADDPMLRRELLSRPGRSTSSPMRRALSTMPSSLHRRQSSPRRRRTPADGPSRSGRRDRPVGERRAMASLITTPPEWHVAGVHTLGEGDQVGLHVVRRGTRTTNRFARSRTSPRRRCRRCRSDRRSRARRRGIPRAAP